MAEYFLLEFIDLRVPVINLLGHLVHVPARLLLIHLQVLDLLERLLELLILLLDDLVDVLVMHIALLDLILFAQNHCRNALMNLAQ